LGIPPENIAANRVSESDNPDDQTKTDYINELKAQEKRVAMVGDAGNDALSIAASNFGIAVNSGDEITKDNAGALIHNASLLPVVTAFTVAEETIWSVKQNLVISLVYNMTVILLACGILVAIGFALNPAIGVALMVLQMTLVLLNQYRIKCQELNHLKRYEAEQTKYGSNQSTYQNCLQNGLVPQPQSELDPTIKSELGLGYQQVVSQQGVETSSGCHAWISCIQSHSFIPASRRD
jgi:Cu2+-exporting ATPase